MNEPKELDEELDEQIDKLDVEAHKAADALEAGEVDLAAARFEAAEERLAKVEAALAKMEADLGGKAAGDHEHPLPAGMQSISDALAEMDEEDVEPENTHWLYRRRGGR